MNYNILIENINKELSPHQDNIKILTEGFVELKESYKNPTMLMNNTFEVLKSAELAAMDTYDDEDLVFNTIKFYDELKTDKCLLTDNNFFKTMVDLMFAVEGE